MRSYLLLTTLIALSLSCTREPERTRRPRARAPADVAATVTPPGPTTSVAATADAATSGVMAPEAPVAAPPVPQRWTGEADALGDAAQQARAIVVARLDRLGVPTLTAGAAEATAFNATTWTVSRSLKGSLEGEVRLRLSVQTLPAERVEQVPRPGESYVVFVGGGSAGANQIRKLLPGTPENVSQVVALAGR